MGGRMSLKGHILLTQLDKFQNNIEVYAKEQGEGFECPCQGQYNEKIDYNWSLIRENTHKHKRKSNN